MSKGRTDSSSVGSRGFGEESVCTKERSAVNWRVLVRYRDDAVNPEVLGKRRRQVRYDLGCGGVSEGGGKVFGVIVLRAADMRLCVLAMESSECECEMRREARNAVDADAERGSKCGGCGCGKGLEMRRMRMRNGTQNAMDAENGKETRNVVDAEAKKGTRNAEDTSRVGSTPYNVLMTSRSEDTCHVARHSKSWNPVWLWTPLHVNLPF
ncbi:hypothetical protein FIBSPDRAFT_897569 [Athelia psychrophila]|uniref:Uncharacterized protein n=1 Tax=Athelia psychrophila TaxID=1759441 RepID=A0A166C110_9AGAM|nr:hypothetical protein FIBSPDRAFT_897569 [Fibularhizoctonia sp. CBS 109695]